MGDSGRQLVTFCRAEGIDPEAHPKLAQEASKKSTQLTSESGYRMVFGEQRHLHLTPAQSFALDDDYPVSNNAYSSLPAYIRARLERDDNLQVLATYDPETGEFEDAVLPEETDPGDLFEWIGLNMTNGLSLHQAVDYLAVEKTETFSNDEWATIREVDTETIKANITAAREEHVTGQ